MNEAILKAVNTDNFDECGYTLFQAICALNAVRQLPQMQDEKIALKRLRSTITMLDHLMSKDDANDK